MARRLKVALVQARPVAGDFTDPRNVDRALELAEEACRREPDIIVFPEYFPFRDSERLAAKAADCGAFIVAGVAYGEGGVLYNTATVYGPGGDVVLRQGKRCIGRLEARLWGFRPWPHPYKVLDVGVARVGIAVCADFWSAPEAAMELFLGGAEIFINPSYMFSLAKHWLEANKARSLEFYAPVVGVDTAAFELRSKRYVFAGGGLSHVVAPPASPEEAERWWASGAESVDQWVRLVMGTDEAVEVYELDLEGIGRMRRDWWLRMRGVALEEWVRTRRERGYPAAEVVRAR